MVTPAVKKAVIIQRTALCDLRHSMVWRKGWGEQCRGQLCTTEEGLPEPRALVYPSVLHSVSVDSDFTELNQNVQSLFDHFFNKNYIGYHCSLEQ